MEEKEFISKSPSDTLDIGEMLGKTAKKGDLYTVYGELGAGKTHLVKGMARGMGVIDWKYVVSPSFTIMNLYEGDIDLCHVDLYRINGDEVESFALEEFLEKGIVVVEWAQRTEWQDRVIRIEIEVLNEDERRITIKRP